MAARIVGATIIVAVDVVAARLTLAKELGATHVVNAAENDPVAAILEITAAAPILRSNRRAVPRWCAKALMHWARAVLAASSVQLRSEPPRASIWGS